MISAKEAKEQQLQAAYELADRELIKLEKLIKDATFKNNSTITIDSIQKETQNKLEALGYKVSYWNGGSGYGGDYLSASYTISW